jgi:Branched-chain amino acid transport protein (AzlD)
MSVWLGILVGSVAVYSWKLFGFLVPHTVLDNPKIAKIAGLLTVALLSALTGVQMITSGSQIIFDARIPALAVAAVLLRFKAPFIVMVAAAAAVAALIRVFG